MELFFEIQRGKQHIMCDVPEGKSVADLKEIVAGVTQTQLDDITIKRPTNEARTAWETIDAGKTLLELGFTPKTAKASEPAPLAYTIPEDEDKVQIDDLSEATPL